MAAEGRSPTSPTSSRGRPRHHGPGRARDRSGRRHAVRGAGEHQRQEHRVLPEAGLRGGVRAPETFDDLVALTDQIQETGTTPWCFGIESEAATGWPATDWVENLMVINNGTDVYNQWVNHEIPFNDPKVADVLRADGRVAARRGPDQRWTSVHRQLELPHRGQPALRRPAGLLHVPAGQLRRAAGRLPGGVLADLDNTVGVFAMPGQTAEDKPVLGGGDLAGIFAQDNESAQELVKFLASSEFGTTGTASQRRWISPHTDFDVKRVPDGDLADDRQGRLRVDRLRVRRLGPDARRGRVRFVLAEMTAWISGGQDTTTTLDNIESSWPA